VFEPEENGNDIQTVKCLVYLHGSGDRGKSAQEVREGWGLLRLLSKEIEFPFTIFAPICPENKVWAPDLVMAFIKSLKLDRVKKFILCGYSMGATGAYDFQARFPNIVHGIVSVAGRVNTFSEENMAKVSFYAVYGTEDERFHQSKIEERIKTIVRLGGVAKLQTFLGKGHFISDEAFQSQDLVDWIIRS